MAPRLPAPGNDPDDSSQRRGGQRAHWKQTPIPTVEDILRMFMQLNSAVTMGLISTKEASIISRNLQAVLTVQLKREGSGKGGSGYQALADLCRHDPKALNVLEPFLPDEVFEALMKEVAGVPDGTV
jgi:hypothetical protein